jgi:hypothetical protein
MLNTLAAVMLVTNNLAFMTLSPVIFMLTVRYRGDLHTHFFLTQWIIDSIRIKKSWLLSPGHDVRIILASAKRGAQFAHCPLLFIAHNSSHTNRYDTH